MGDIQGDLVLVHLLRRIGRRSSPNICHFAEVSWQAVKIPDGGRSAGDEMAHATSGVAVVVATLVVAFAADLVSAQTCTESDNFPACHTYLQSPIMLTPDPYCCLVLSSVQTTWGAPCYCELLATVNPNLINMTKACALPRDCNVEADMSKCSCGGTSSTATPIPGFTTPTVPSFGTPTPASGSSARKSYAVPLGATAGGLTVGGVIIWVVYLIMSKCDIHVKWDMNQPCCCCYRGPKQPSNSEKADNYSDKDPVRVHGYV